FGWQDFAISDGRGFVPVTKLPPGVPIAMCMSVLGITGLTAYFGMLEVGGVKAGENVLVSGAAGATGSVAAQIAKLRGARVVGIAGGAEKCRWLTQDLGLDAAIDYRSEPVPRRIAELFPRGVDIYFDNVGGEILDAALAHLAVGARVALCGAISSYNDSEGPRGPRNYTNLIVYRARMQGFLVSDFSAKFGEAVADREVLPTEQPRDEIAFAEGRVMGGDDLARRARAHHVAERDGGDVGVAGHPGALRRVAGEVEVPHQELVLA